MLFHLLDHTGAPAPRFSFKATGPGEFRAAIASLTPHPHSHDSAQWRVWGDQRIRRLPEAKSWWYTVAAEMPADQNRVWALFSVPQKAGMFIETQVGLIGATQVKTVWPLIVESVEDLDSYLRQLNGLAAFASNTAPPRPELRLVD